MVWKMYDKRFKVKLNCLKYKILLNNNYAGLNADKWIRM